MKDVPNSPVFLMSGVQCEPSDAHAFEACHYQIGWTINPHMQVGGSDFEAALRQHAALKSTLEHIGAQVWEVPFVPGAFDSVFVKDNALIRSDGQRVRALMGQLRHRERQVEQVSRARSYARLGIQVARRSHALEGGDVVVGTHAAFFGYGLRSAAAARREIEAFLARPVVPLRLVDPYLYHLDTAFCLLADGVALACPDAFDTDSWARLERSPYIEELCPISRDAALAFGTNLIEVGDDVVLGSENSEVISLLESFGKRCWPVPLDQFHLAGGSAACLVSKIHPSTLVSRRPALRAPETRIVRAPLPWMSDEGLHRRAS